MHRLCWMLIRRSPFCVVVFPATTTVSLDAVTIKNGTRQNLCLLKRCCFCSLFYCRQQCCTAEEEVEKSLAGCVTLINVNRVSSWNKNFSKLNKLRELPCEEKRKLICAARYFLLQTGDYTNSGQFQTCSSSAEHIWEQTTFSGEQKIWVLQFNIFMCLFCLVFMNEAQKNILERVYGLVSAKMIWFWLFFIWSKREFLNLSILK